MTVSVLLVLGTTPKFVHATPVNVLEAAKAVASRAFPDFGYGDDLKSKQVNCVQFIGQVVGELVGRDLTRKEIDAISIRYEIADLDRAVEAGDVQTRGVQNALCNVMKIGEAVTPQNVQQGDFIQYWIRSEGGVWHGHSAIVAEVLERNEQTVRVSIYGAHKSTNGIAVTDFGGNGLLLTGKQRRIYLARYLGESSDRR